MRILCDMSACIKATVSVVEKIFCSNILLQLKPLNKRNLFFIFYWFNDIMTAIWPLMTKEKKISVGPDFAFWEILFLLLPKLWLWNQPFYGKIFDFSWQCLKISQNIFKIVFTNYHQIFSKFVIFKGNFGLQLKRLEQNPDWPTLCEEFIYSYS